MKLTKKLLKQIIKEECEKVLFEEMGADPYSVFAVGNRISSTGSELIDTLIPLSNRGDSREEMIEYLEDQIELLQGVSAEDAVDWFFERTQS